MDPGDDERDRQVLRVIGIEGAANAVVLLAKVVVGLATGSFAILAEALHSLTDLSNNVVAFFIVRLSSKPPDREHPYGHRRFETLAVFVLATLLTVLAVQLALGAWERKARPVESGGVYLVVMLGVLAVNTVVALWQNRQARRLESDILLADARHTFSDVLMTGTVIGGWQLSARGFAWLDTACALGVAAVVGVLAYGLFRRALPSLVGRVAVEPEALSRAARRVPGVREVDRVRSRWEGSLRAADLVVRVDARLPTDDSHAIADEVERTLRRELSIADVTVHVEPDSS
jgi:cation diffusion facilitator family transporter